MFAARYGHAALVEYLLAQAKVDATAINKDGKTAAELAEFWGSSEAVAVFDRLAPNKNKVQQSAGSPFGQPSAMAAGAGITTAKPSTEGQKASGIAEWWNKWTVQEARPLHFTGATHNR